VKSSTGYRTLLTNPGTLVQSCCQYASMSRDERQWKIKGSITSLEANFSTVISVIFALVTFTALSNEDKNFFLMTVSVCVCVCVCGVWCVCVHACERAEIQTHTPCE
jgi:Na+/melibiose symporter-like transporter